MDLFSGQDTIPKLFRHSSGQRGTRAAFREKHLGIWRATSWRDYGERARRVGLGLVTPRAAARRRRLDPRRDDARNGSTPTWAPWRVGGVSNGIYPTDSAKQVEYILNDSRSRFLFVENEEQLDKILEVRERCPHARQGHRLRHGGAAATSATRRCMLVRRAAGARP